MGRWRRLRWALFLVSIGIDGLVFYYAEPFTPRSFMASGLAALLLFLVFVEIASMFSATGRIRRALVGKEHIKYQVGRHLIALLRNINQDPVAKRAIYIPLLISALSTVAIGVVLWSGAVAKSGSEAWSDWAQYGCAGYTPLLLAMPFVVEHMSEWRSHQYVVIVDQELKKPSLLIHFGVFSYDLETVSLDRTVTTQLHQSFWDSFIGYGDVELRETAGGADAQRLEAVWRPRKLEREIRLAIRNSRRGAPTD